MKSKQQKELVHITEKGRTFKQRNANPICRKSFINRFGDTIAVMGRHGFEWTVVVSKTNGSIQSTTFDSRVPALNFYNKKIKEF